MQIVLCVLIWYVHANMVDHESVVTQHEFIDAGMVLLDRREMSCAQGCGGIMYLYAMLGRIGTFQVSTHFLDYTSGKQIPLGNVVHHYFYFCHTCGAELWCPTLGKQ